MRSCGCYQTLRRRRVTPRLPIDGKLPPLPKNPSRHIHHRQVATDLVTGGEMPLCRMPGDRDFNARYAGGSSNTVIDIYNNAYLN